jgi:hypothetical protein
MDTIDGPEKVASSKNLEKKDISLLSPFQPAGVIKKNITILTE